MNIIDQIYQVKPNEKLPQISPGDTVKVAYKIKEANKERIQNLSGLVIKIRRGNGGGNFTIRRVSSGVGVEHTFPFASPLLDKIEITRHGKVRRAKLYYIRRLSAKEARLKERRERMLEEQAVTEVEAAPEAVAAPETTTAAE
jgi:large subunit ribosomal protein L19